MQPKVRTQTRGTMKHGVPKGSTLGPLLFITYTNDLPPTQNTSSIPIIFPDDTSVTISSKHLNYFCINCCGGSTLLMGCY